MRRRRAVSSACNSYGPHDHATETLDCSFRCRTATGSPSLGGGTAGDVEFAMYDTPKGSSRRTAEE